MMAAIANHIWQSTLCVAVALLLTRLLRHAPARVRYRVWLLAAIKFVIPFAILVAAGSRLPLPALSSDPTVSVAAEVIARPFAAAPVVDTGRVSLSLLSLLTRAGLVAWALGLVLLAIRRSLAWGRMNAAVANAMPLMSGREHDAVCRTAARVGLRAVPAMRVTAARTAPGVIGTVRPIVLWPSSLSPELSDRELEAVLAHELAHVRRNDNLHSALFACVQAVFWFNPAVWWLGRRLLVERERACDEAVLDAGARNGCYAAGLLKVCRFCLDVPIACAAAANGSDLSQRVEDIMTFRDRRTLGAVRSALLLMVAVMMVGLPIALGARAIELPAAASVPMTAIAPAAMLTADMVPVPRTIEAPRNPAAGSGQDPAPAPTQSPDAPPTSSADTAPPPAPPDASTSPAAPQVRIGGDIKEPKKIRDVKPAYPEVAKTNGVEGIVLMEVVIATDGWVKDAAILRGHPLLNQAALDAVAQWRFMPTIVNEQPVEVVMDVTINFTLQQ